VPDGGFARQTRATGIHTLSAVVKPSALVPPAPAVKLPAAQHFPLPRRATRPLETRPWKTWMQEAAQRGDSEAAQILAVVQARASAPAQAPHSEAPVDAAARVAAAAEAKRAERAARRETEKKAAEAVSKPKSKEKPPAKRPRALERDDPSEDAVRRRRSRSRTWCTFRRRPMRPSARHSWRSWFQESAVCWT
jgi:hypothetical protein